MQEVVKELKASNPVVVSAPHSYLVLFDPRSQEAIKRMDESYPGWEECCFVPVPSHQLLGLYLKEVPDIAWNLIEYAESPLIVLFKGCKNIADRVDGKQIGIMKCTEGLLHDVIYRYEKPLVAIHPSLDWTVPALNKPVGRFAEPALVKDLKFKSYTVMQLDLDGQVTFLRKGE